MKTMFLISVGLAISLLGLFFGAEKLGLLNATQQTISIVYGISLIYYAILAYAASTISGDRLAAKFCGYRIGEKRWLEFDDVIYLRQGFGLRFVLLAMFEAPFAYFGALWLRMATS
jgi:hypothetical protein